MPLAVPLVNHGGINTFLLPTLLFPSHYRLHPHFPGLPCFCLRFVFNVICGNEYWMQTEKQNWEGLGTRLHTVHSLVNFSSLLSFSPCPLCLSLVPPSLFLPFVYKVEYFPFNAQQNISGTSVLGVQITGWVKSGFGWLNICSKKFIPISLAVSNTCCEGEGNMQQYRSFLPQMYAS